MCVGEQAPKSSKYDFSKIYIQNYKNQKFLGSVRWVRWVRWVRQLVEATSGYNSKKMDEKKPIVTSDSDLSLCFLLLCRQ